MLIACKWNVKRKGVGREMIGRGNGVGGILQEEGWELSEDDKFSVKDLRDLIDEKTLGSTRRQFATPWCKSDPKKVCFYMVAVSWEVFSTH
nr:hypothetical protein [Tanacetum cinerariifolium]